MFTIAAHGGHNAVVAGGGQQVGHPLPRLGPYYLLMGRPMVGVGRWEVD